MVLQYLNFLDLFRRPIYLHFNNREKTSSRLGLVFSVGIYVLVLLEFLRSDIFFHKAPKVIIQDITDFQRRNLKFQDKLFTVSIVDDNSLGYYADPSIFSIVSKNVYMTISPNGGYDFKHIEEKSLHLCDEKDFPDANVSLNLGLNNYSYCLDNNSFEMHGYWDEPTLAYFEFLVVLCDNETSQVVCQTPEQIQEFFVMKYFNLVFAGLKIDVENYTNPLDLKYRNIYELIEPRLNKMMNVFMKDIIVKTEDGIILSNKIEVVDTSYDSKESDLAFIDPNSNAPIFTCDFYSSRNHQSITRTYQTISEVFANVGGLLSFLMACGFGLTYIENTLSLQVKIMNRLYSFQKKPDRALSSTKTLADERKSLMIASKINVPTIPNLNMPKIFSLENFDEEKFNEPSAILKKQEIQLTESSKKRIAIESLFVQPKNLKEDEPTPELIESPKNFKKAKTYNEINFNDNEMQRDRTDKKINFMESSKNSINKSISKKGFNMKQINLFPNTRKSNAITDFKKFQAVNNNSLTISVWEYFKFKIHKLCTCCAKGFKEKLFLKAEKIYESEVDVVNILQRLQNLEKLKLILLNEKQISLFNLMAKPMIYSEKSETKEGGYYMSEMISATVKKENLKYALEYYEKLGMTGNLNEIDQRLFNLLDQNIKEFKNYFEEK